MVTKKWRDVNELEFSNYIDEPLDFLPLQLSRPPTDAASYHAAIKPTEIQSAHYNKQPEIIEELI